MKTIEIEVSDANYEKVMDLLGNLKYIASVRAGAHASTAHSGKAPATPETGETAGNPVLSAPFAGSAEAAADPENSNPAKLPERQIDEVTLMSQSSLAEEWNSEEDADYDRYYREKYLKNDVPKR